VVWGAAGIGLNLGDVGDGGAGREVICGGLAVLGSPLETT